MDVFIVKCSNVMEGIKILNSIPIQINYIVL